MTTKQIFLAALVALTVVSCSTEREDEVNSAKPAATKSELKPIKVEKNNNQGNTARPGDSTTVQPQIAMPPTGPTDPNDPEIIPPGDIKPPKP